MINEVIKTLNYNSYGSYKRNNAYLKNFKKIIINKIKNFIYVINKTNSIKSIFKIYG